MLDNKEFTSYARAGRLIPFVGAGFSRSLNNTFPTWSGALATAANLLGYDYNILRIVANQYQIGQILKSNARAKAAFVRELRDTLNDPALARIDASTPHWWLAKIRAPCIYTTNWDHWIERSLKVSGRTFRLVRIADDLQKPQRSIDVIKYHGDLALPNTMIYAEDDYFDRISLDHPFDVMLRAHVLQNAMLFLGYSFSDINIQYLWYRIRRSLATSRTSCRAFMVIFGRKSIVKEHLHDVGIRIVALDPTNPTASLANFLKMVVQLQS